MKITINTLTNKLLELKVNKNMKIIELKKVISNIEKLDLDSIKLLDQENTFNDNNTLSFYKINDGSEIYLLINN